MQINIHKSKKETGQKASLRGENIIVNAQRTQPIVRIVFATGSSQFDLLQELSKSSKINWKNCEIYHLDEYIGLDSEHSASFVNYLNERLISKIRPVFKFHSIDGKAANITYELQRLNNAIHSKPIDLAFIGIGENSHLAFNDPPADHRTEEPFIKVVLDKKCRQQQVTEGWFKTIDEVPRNAITMSLKQILKSQKIICTVSEQRKAKAVQSTVHGPVTNLCPASYLQKHKNTFLMLDEAAANLLRN